MTVAQFVELLAKENVPLDALLDVRLPLFTFGKLADDYPVRKAETLDVRNGEDGSYYVTLII